MRSEGLSVLELVRTKVLILMRQPVDTNVLAELEEIEIEFSMYKYERYDSLIHCDLTPPTFDLYRSLKLSVLQP